MSVVRRPVNCARKPRRMKKGTLLKSAVVQNNFISTTQISTSDRHMEFRRRSLQNHLWHQRLLSMSCAQMFWKLGHGLRRQHRNFPSAQLAPMTDFSSFQFGNSVP
ncbi:hypothetical protein V5799_010600 [Amblyomma americanum]|uniref:Uncharacterized protein n=1 Tax=Amblyomma americanum TaxID=6943 RepID=A0AAQ4EJ98_AMBAM